jgi:hypothetical protein
VTLPIVLRLTRQGDTITAEYSLDEGKTFAAGGAYTFAPPLEKSLFAGLYVNAGNEDSSRRATSEAKFSGAVIQKP